jgi:hypothetical protein
VATALENPQESSSDKLSFLGQSLAVLCRLLPSTHHTHLLALSNMLLRPVPRKLNGGEGEPNDGKLLADVCAQLSPQDLAELLKYSVCTGEAEHIVLGQLEAKTQRDFAVNAWKFAEQANSLVIKDVDSPAKRPSVADALTELEAFVGSVLRPKTFGGRFLATEYANTLRAALWEPTLKGKVCQASSSIQMPQIHSPSAAFCVS